MAQQRPYSDFFSDGPNGHGGTPDQPIGMQDVTFSRPVYARISRSTDRHASVPELTKRTISTDGTRPMTSFASTFCERAEPVDTTDQGDWLTRRASAQLEQICDSATDLQLARGAKGGALVDLRLQRVVDLVIRGAHDGGAPAADIVDVLVAVDVPAMGALHAVEDDRAAAHGLERANRRVDAARQQVLRLLEYLQTQAQKPPLRERVTRFFGANANVNCAWRHNRPNTAEQRARIAYLL